MTRGVALALVIAGLAGCDSLPGKPTEADRPRIPSEVTDFATLYGRNCAGCHGADGRLGAARSLHDPVYLALADAAVLRQVIRDGVPGTSMPGFGTTAGGTLTDAQIDILVEQMRARWGGSAGLEGAPPPYRPTAPGDPQAGLIAYGSYCARCHGPEGRGGRDGGPVTDGSYLALVSDQALRTTIIAGRTDLGMPDWREAAPGRWMSDREITDVVAWLASQRRSSPGQPYPQENPQERPDG